MLSEQSAEVWQAAVGWWERATRPARIAVVATGVVVAVVAGRWASGAGALVPGGGEQFAVDETSGAVEAKDAAPAASVVVHVVGAVRRPGVYSLPAGSRVIDALDAAGGTLGSAALEAVNLARVLVDGEQVRVLTRDETSGTPAPGGERGGARSRVNINAADASVLESLPGIGPATAQKIVSDREKNGPFGKPEDLMRVPGIGPKKFEAIKDLITVG